MSDYVFRYQLNAPPQARSDGSGQVAHSIRAVYQVQGEPDGWLPVPNHQITILVPGADLLNALSTGTNNQKVVAYKQLLVDHATDGPTPLATGWDLEVMEQFMDANEVSREATMAAYAFIVQVAGAYPVTFSL